MANTNQSKLFPSVDADRQKCELFLHNYNNKYQTAKQAKYIDKLQLIADRKLTKLDIELDDVQEYFESLGEQADLMFVEQLERNAKRYIRLFAEAADALMPDPSGAAVGTAAAQDPQELPNIKRMITEKRTESMRAESMRHGEPSRSGTEPDAAASGLPGGPPSDLGRVPAALLRRFEVYFQPRTANKAKKLRSVSANDVGALVKLRGIVTHVSDVKPVVSIMTYIDPASGYEIYQEVLGRSFMPLNKPTNSRMPWSSVPVMTTRHSKFVKYQEARIQEMVDEVPEGGTPRTMSVRLMGELTRTLKAGDEVVVSGIYLPEPYTGFRAMKAGLVTSTYLEAMAVEQVKTSYAKHSLSEEDLAAIQEIADAGDIYTRLAQSIAPEIYGHEDVKKALLLLMVGGCTRIVGDGMKLRGDVHLCLMGDPGVAKSQLLKYVTRVSPRAMYTTGKGSSGVGLTAAVLRDQVTKELMLEGGALVLADKGICCIDEFDKMEEADRTAIHEVMEQQTVSIAKAGITTTLNTRTSILAAANPAWSRYDKRKTAAENINMPAALLSRFDLLWLMLDKSDSDMDRALAEHIVSVHNGCQAPRQAQGREPLKPSLLRSYIAYARTHEPTIPTELTDYISDVYAEMRATEASELESKGTYTTARTLLSILRLGQALARLRFDTTVIQSDVDEALRLMEMSKSSLRDEGGAGAHREDPVSAVYRTVLDCAQRSGENEFTYARIRQLTQRLPNIMPEVIEQCIREYADIGLWVVVRDSSGVPTVTIPLENLS